jgi:dolichyl-phosphate beta-glucosyltransferase
MAMTSIILPVYNCAPNLDKGLGALQSYLENTGAPYEIIVVDDGSASQADTVKVAQKYACNVVAFPENKGKGAAVQSGVLAAKGDLVIFMDGDFPFHLSAIGGMIDELQSGRADVVIGDRTLQESRYPSNIEPARKAGSKILSMIISTFYVRGFRDTQCGIKGFTAAAGKRIFSKLTLYRFSFDVEVLFIARRNRLVINRIPVQVYEQAGSSVRIWRDGFAMLGSLLKICVNNIVGKYRF